VSVGPDDVDEARRRISGLVRLTPVIEVEVAGRAVTLKLELLQHTGSFKPRGAFNRVIVERDEGRIPGAGLITASGGNHGAAVAHVAQRLGIPAEVFVTDVTPAMKRQRIAELGGRVVIGGRHYPDALVSSHLRAAETGALEIHAYDHELTVAGQGTMAAEISEQVDEVGSVLVAVGGGGLAGGVAAWFGTKVDVVCVEPSGSAAFHAARGAGVPVDVEIDSLAADSLGAKRVGAVPFSVLSAAGATSTLVEDVDIAQAQRWLWDRLRLIVEPGGAAAFAAVLSGRHEPRDDGTTVVVVCGANADPATIVADG
jgi:threonine dehydratase